MANIGYIQIIRICNQHCLFCSNPENDKTLSLDNAKKQLLHLKNSGYQGVILTGGEPSLHPELLGIVRFASEQGIQVRMITNGQKTAESGMLEELKSAGLFHIHLSIHSMQEKVQNFLSKNDQSFANIVKTLDIVGKIGLICDINTVICAQNADHLDQNVKTLINDHPSIRHFVFNNIDSKMNRVAENPDTVSSLAKMELSLHNAMEYIDNSGRTFRVERVPLCYMVEFAHCSTETRKIVKQEERTVHFLDEKQKVCQKDFFHQKTDRCQACSLDSICAGLYDLGGAYDPAELHAIFVDPQEIINRILSQ
jgi:MoaA/NifB/PqqE/SkfB family radical SAM enzyme